MGFGSCNRTLKIWESIWYSNSHNGSSLGSVRVHSLTLFALLGACEVISSLPLGSQPCNPLALVAKRVIQSEYKF